MLIGLLLDPYIDGCTGDNCDHGDNDDNDDDEKDDVDDEEESLCKAKLFTRLFHLDSRSY